MIVMISRESDEHFPTGKGKSIDKQEKSSKKILPGREKRMISRDEENCMPTYKEKSLQEQGKSGVIELKRVKKIKRNEIIMEK